MPNHTLVILGMHRSGTSLITNWLHQCKLEVGERLLGPALGNAEGHFEDVEFTRLHEEILRDNGLPDNGFISEAVKTISPYHEAKIKGVISVKDTLYKQWGWKDPRTCLFLNLYRHLLPEAKYFVIIRDYKAVVISLLKRDIAELNSFYNESRGYFSKLAYKLRHKRFSEKYYHRKAAFHLRTWIHYNENVLNFIQTLPTDNYFAVSYADLITRDDKVFSHLTENWGFKLDYQKFSSIYKEGMVSKPFDVDQYITDPQLISYAKELEGKLRGYIAV